MDKDKRDTAGVLCAVLLAAIGAASVWAARDFSDLGAVFPSTVGALMLVLGLLYLVFGITGKGQSTAALEGSLARRVALALVMLFWVFTLDALGFLVSSALSMGALLWIANYDRWHLRSVTLYGGSALLLLLGFYVLFKVVLGVPLPV